MVVEKIHETISFKQNKWLGNYRSFNTKKRNRAENDFEKDFYRLLVKAAFGKMMENIHNRLRLEIFKKGDFKIFIERQSKMFFHGNHKSYQKCDSYTFKQNEVLMDKPIYDGFTIFDLSKLHMYNTC